jgi:hypothetical protein
MFYCVPSKRFLSLTPHHAAPVLCWPQTFKELRFPDTLFSRPSFLPKAGAKVQPFCEPASTFLQNFSSFCYLADLQQEKTLKTQKKEQKQHLINI